MNVLWVTSFAKDMWEASGKDLLASFERTKSEGQFFVGTEGIDAAALKAVSSRAAAYDLDTDSYLRDFLAKHRGIIPQHLGGTHPVPECRCAGGPFDVHDKRHTQPCVGAWFNRNFSRWFRKIATLHAVLHTRSRPDVIIWIDADCHFLRRATLPVIKRWFGGMTKGIFYFRHTRPVMEAGIVGYNLKLSLRGLQDFIKRYDSGAFCKDPRWDDSFQLQRVLDTKRVTSLDLARRVGEHAEVVAHSIVGTYIQHKKGRHGRGLGIMT
jgi:hypothetical protein